MYSRIISYLILIFILNFLVAAASAQSIYFQFTNGTTATYSTSSVRKVTHSGSVLNLLLTNGSSFTYLMDDIVYYNFEDVPMILSGAASIPDYDSLCVGSASSPASYSLQGYRMTDNIQVSAPSGFEVSASMNSDYGSSLILSPVSGRVNATVYVRFLPDISDATTGFKKINGYISHASSGALLRSLGVFGISMLSGAYIGPDSGNWGEHANWCGGLPTMTTDVLIPSGKTVLVNTNADVKSLNILSGATLQGGASTLSVYGNWNNAGTFQPQTGTIAFRGATGDVSLSDDFYNLIVNKTSGSVVFNNDITVSNQLTLASDSLIISPGYRLDLPGTANFGGQRVIIKSDATGTASIGVLGNNGAGLSGANNVTVERYIPAKRAWRLVTAPLTGSSGNSIYDNWQNTGSGSGATIFSPAGTGASGNGITQGGIASSILSYNNSSNTWDAVLNTKTTPLFESANGTNKSYALFITGPAGSSISASAQPTTLRPTGTLQKGTVTFGGLTANQFHLIGNPYASPVKLNTVSNTVGSNTTNAVYVWDAKGSSFGRYKTWDPSLKWTIGGSPSGDNYGNDVIIQSGQAFFVRALSGSNATLIFSESDKVSNHTSNVTFRNNTVPKLMRIELGRIINNEMEIRDAAAVQYDETFYAGIDDQDVVKFPNPDENLAIRRNNLNLVIERRYLLSPTDTIYLRTSNLAQAGYQLGVRFENFQTPDGLSIFLQDIAGGTEQPIFTGQNNQINFSVNASNSSLQDRFRIIFRINALTPVNNMSGDKGCRLFPNPIVKAGNMQLELRNRPAGMYTITMYTMDGLRVQQDYIRHYGGNTVQKLVLEPHLAAGSYLVEVMNQNGEKEQLKLTIQ